MQINTPVVDMASDATMLRTTVKMKIGKLESTLDRLTSLMEEHPPDGCLQYHTDLDGRFTTFNFAPLDESHIKNHDYSICIRQEAGFCCVEYSVCPDVAETSMTLSLGDSAAKLDRECATEDYVGIPGSGGFCSPNGPMNLHSRYCGNKLNAFTGATDHAPICDCTAPFDVRIHTNAKPDVEIANTAVSRDFKLREELLRQEKATKENFYQVAITWESAANVQRTLAHPHEVSVAAVSSYKKNKSNHNPKPEHKSKANNYGHCHRCGNKGENPLRECFAKDAVCQKGQKIGHITSACYTGPYHTDPKTKEAIQEDALAPDLWIARGHGFQTEWISSRPS
eukprot:maker-scaffold112_size353035-snap-gene-1.18 protein:Tk07396 transcript:maker-scaffold112_size353035-snap-gene-1.18-mRNA-1 annotation:"PREDICTED: uncharacterized protein LOC101893744"